MKKMILAICLLMIALTGLVSAVPVTSTNNCVLSDEAIKYLADNKLTTPTTEIGCRAINHKVTLEPDECPIILPATEYRSKILYIGIWGRNSKTGKFDICFTPRATRPQPAVVTPVCHDKTITTTTKHCGYVCDEYKDKCVTIKGEEHCVSVCSDWRSDGQNPCKEYFQEYVCDKYEGSGWKKKCVEGHWQDTSICKKYTDCNGLLQFGHYYNTESSSTESVCN